MKTSLIFKRSGRLDHIFSVGTYLLTKLLFLVFIFILFLGFINFILFLGFINFILFWVL